MDIGTYQQTMRLLAKIDKKQRELRKEKEEEMSAIQTFVLTLIMFGGFVLLLLF